MNVSENRSGKVSEQLSYKLSGMLSDNMLGICWKKLSEQLPAKFLEKRSEKLSESFLRFSEKLSGKFLASIQESFRKSRMGKLSYKFW